MRPKTVAVSVVGGVFVVFLVQNLDVVRVRFLLWEVEMSRALLLLLLSGLGLGIGWVLRGRRERKKEKRLPNAHSRPLRRVHAPDTENSQ